MTCFCCCIMLSRQKAGSLQQGSPTFCSPESYISKLNTAESYFCFEDT